MSANNLTAVSAFIEGAPPGELADVVNDIKALTTEDRDLLESARPAFKKYDEEQLTAVRLPDRGKNVLISSYNSLGDGRYYDFVSQSSFAFDHITQKASDIQSHTPNSQHTDLISSLTKTLATHAREHYPSSTSTVCPANDSLALLLSASKFSPSNFWNGRLRTTYLYHPISRTLTGSLKCDVHYYEDGNVRLLTKKEVPETTISGGGGVRVAAEVLRVIAKIEKGWQEELNRGFGRLSEGEFKGLRRQLPVTRQKVEWEKIGGYRAGKDIGGGGRR